MTLPPEEEQEFREFLQRKTGFSIPEGRWRFLAPRFFSRLEGRGFGTMRSYLHYLETDPLGRNELEEIFFLLTVRKTSFFRNPNSYLALAHEVLPRLARERAVGLPLALWSAGCSTGEEPYTLAMVAKAALEKTDQSCYVLATDIVKEALSTAREASYPEANLAGIPPEYRRFFRVEGGRAGIADEIRELVEFTEHNLVHDPLPRSAVGQWDVIFCRNVFIYFEASQALEILRQFTRVLSPGGALFLGHAEVFTDIEDEFEVVFWGDTFYYRRRADPRVHPVRHPDPPPAPRIPPPVTHDPDGETKSLPRPSPSPVPERRPPPRPAPEDAPTRKIKRPASQRRDQPATRPIPRSLLGKKTFESDTHRWAGVRLPREQILKAERSRQTGDPEGAARALRAACAQAPRWAKPRIMLAEIYLENAELNHARHELEVATEAEPLAYRAHHLLGALYTRMGDPKRAEVSLRRALYLEPDFVPARYDLAEALRACSKYDRACRELRSLLRTLRSLEPARLLAMTQGMKIPAKDLRAVCEREIGEMGGTTQDSGVWRLPPVK